MGRFFLSGQTTCALLLGAGLLLRAQAALRSQDTPPAAPAAIAAPHTRPAEFMTERAPRIPRQPAPALAAPTKPEQRNSHTRKGFAHRERRRRVHKCGVAVAGRWFRCG